MNSDLENAYTGKRVLITGATGFKGSWLCLCLERLGAHIIGYSLEPNTQRDNYVVCGLEKRITHIVGDVNDFNQIMSVFEKYNPEIVFHLAAQPLVIESYKNPLDTYMSNVNGTFNVLEAVRLTKSVLAGIFITSDKCYQINNKINNYKETDRLGGNDPYSASKAACEIIIHSYIKSFFHSNDNAFIASARAGNVIGGGDWSENRIVPDCIRAIEAGKPIKLRNPHSTRPWQHVLEPLSGYLLLGKYLLEDGKSYQSSWNFGPNNNESKSVKDLIIEIINQMGAGKIEVEKTIADYKESDSLLIDINKAKTKLNWSPRLSFNELISMTLDEYQIKSLNVNEVHRQRQDHINNYFGM